MAGCHKQSVLKCTERDPFIAGRATEEFTVRQRGMCGKPLYLTLDLVFRNGVGGLWCDLAGLKVPGWRGRVTPSVMDDSLGHYPEPLGVKHAT